MSEVPAAKFQRLLTVQELAERLNTTERQCRRLVHERRIPHLHVGRKLRFDWSAIDAWLEAQAVEAEA